VSGADATMTAAKATESVDGGEAVGIPSLWEAVGGLATALSQGTTVAREAGRLGLELTRIAWGAVRRGSGQGRPTFRRSCLDIEPGIPDAPAELSRLR
jgi:hypothetical protein